MDMDIEDARSKFIGSYIVQSLKIREDKFEKFYSGEENKQILLNFFTVAENVKLIAIANPSGTLTCQYTWPLEFKGKACYFIKKARQVLDKGVNLKRSLFFGDLSATPLEQLSAVIDEVFLPIVVNKKNLKMWPKVVADDICKHFEDLKNEIFIVSGWMRGKTLLPLPTNAISRISMRSSKPQSVSERNAIRTVENVVAEWDQRIHDVIQKKSDEIFAVDPFALPTCEIKFWVDRAANLDCLHDQLRHPEVQKMAHVLANYDSEFLQILTGMIGHVEEALSTAVDVSIHLKCLDVYLQDFEQAQFDDCESLLRAIMESVCLIWGNCAHYRKPNMIILILRQIANLIIQLCNGFVEPAEILKGEVEEVIVKVRKAIGTIEFFKSLYNDCKENLSSYASDSSCHVPWEFSSFLVFDYLDEHLKRLGMVQRVMQDALDYEKLEKVELGGNKGYMLSLQVTRLLEEFQDLWKMFSQSTYDCLDLQDTEGFVKDEAKFRKQVEVMDRKLATIITRGFDDCGGLESVFSLMIIFESFLERPVIKREFAKKFGKIVSMMDREIMDVKFIFDRNVEQEVSGEISLNHKSMPLISGAIKWAEELKQRIGDPMSEFLRMDNPLRDTFNVQSVMRKYSEMKGELESYSDKVYEQWLSGVEATCKFNLKQPILKRSGETNLLSVNFDPQLVAVLKEVKYLQMASKENIPSTALELFEKNETLREYMNNLNMTVSLYNKIREQVLEIEMALIDREMTAFDEQLKAAETSLNWDDPGVLEFSKGRKDAIIDLDCRIQQTKDNVIQINRLIETWSSMPLLERKEGRNESLINLDDRNERFNRRYTEVAKVGDQIHKMLRNNLELLKAEEESANWTAYVEYMDEMIIEGFYNNIHCSLQFLIAQSSPDTKLPLFETHMSLEAPEIVFKPAIESDHGENVYDIVDSLISDIFKQASLVKRLMDSPDSEDYQTEIEEIEELNNMRFTILERVEDASNKALEFKNSFDSFAYLWIDDRHEFMRHFLKFGRVLSQEEIDSVPDVSALENPPTLDKFKEQIDYYENLYHQLEKRETTEVINSWFRIDLKKFKYSLLNVIKRWSLLFKQHLIDHTTSSLSELESFIKTTSAALSKPIEEGDYDGLVGCMGHLMGVKEREEYTNAMFEPMKQSVELLEHYKQEVKDEVYKHIEELPEMWATLVKKVSVKKQQVAPLQAIEVSNIRKKIAAFDVKQHEFRAAFRKIRPFFYDCESPYEELDQHHLLICELENDMNELQKSAGLFEVSFPDFRQLKQSRKEISLLKMIWDYIYVVRSSIASWTGTAWKEINVDVMDLECKRYTKEIRGLDKEMRAWDSYTGLETEIKNMLTSLRAVSELQNPAIRERHWRQLMQTTKVVFVMDDNTNLGDLLSLNLHNFEDEVKNIVDKATKETAMEKVINELNNTWNQMEFEQETHKRTGITLIKANDELIEILEENQVQLQNMLTSKYISHFLEEVTRWQKSLSTADQAIAIFMDVQRAWSHLESIFIGSEDIRKQLPKESLMFDEIDVKFKEIAGEMSQSKNVIVSTTKPKLYERLERIQDNLAICEKALAEYLETKRLAFPRFYFVSSADLLDILSNGNQPELVSKHLVKLFDSMAKLEFTRKGDATTNIATAMIAKDGEKVEFDKPCDCTGQVEVWLNRLLDTQCSTVRYYLTESITAYEEKSRDQWIMDFPAQVSLTGSQIWWSTEVNIAFDRLEEGYENALKDYNKKQINQLASLIGMLIGELTPNERQKIMTICTIDVHARDIVAKLIQQKVENSQAFTWLCQLRHMWDELKKDCFINICDAGFRYSHEYLGCTPRLVITPLTDRCYITLTQSLHLIMSGAPAGPAGTGKTETTKDLGKSIGIMVYVFNCSEQMDYKSVGNIYKGLAQSGAWGCFDEFNRISVEVLSVVAVQVKTIQDAIRDKKDVFNFMGTDIRLVPTVGIFITMNPGYAGRTELPENLKALFRPCAMVVPDFEMICEIMLVAEGFTDARILARKFITLYSLCKELLSKQDHYDWGLRAIKSVLVVAGSLKRADLQRPEDQVLMRALRDFNIPKIVTDDLPIFIGLIGDLFPSLDVPRKRNLEFEKSIRQATLDLKLQPEDNFVMKVVQLVELLEVRHSVFIIGNAGVGKSMIWKTLLKTYRNLGQKGVAVDLNPKAVTNDELYGVINPATREWKDGLFSVIMRDLSNASGTAPKWIILDSDIDPMWIESLNTVMDDNKVLTLASNERISLTPSMRLIFEISHLKTATPATVSRAGILFINPADVGWSPYVNSWIEAREVQSEKANLTILFDKYVPTCLETMKTRFKKITPISDIAHVQMLCSLLEIMLIPENTPPDCSKELYEIYFVFSCVWAFGSCLFQDQLTDYRVDFSKWWTTEFKQIKFPSAGTLFDYFVDNKTNKFEPWSKLIPKFELDPDPTLQSTLVQTQETVRIRWFLDKLMEIRRPCMLVGAAGTGKSVLMQNKLKELSDDFLVANVPFNFYTTSAMLQKILERPLEKKAGRNYGPPGSRRLIYFVDDMNMPEVDKYFTVQPHTLLRQHIDYGHWYDRNKLSLKDVHNTQYVACMNPAAGSFTINPRLQRHFCVFAVSFPTAEALNTIYSSILSCHLESGFQPAVKKYVPSLIHGALDLHSKISTVFLPTAIKFHYLFNLRDLSNVFQGVLFSDPDCVKTPEDLARLWLHEAYRVYGDKMVDDGDILLFRKTVKEVVNKSFEDMREEAMFAAPLLYCHFANGIGEAKYMPVHHLDGLKKLLTEALDNYNELNAAMNLVLFEDAMFQVCRINRILENPRGYGLLVGVGGSGKQSLSRLAAFISGLETYQVTLRKGYSLNDLKAEIAQLYLRCGLKNVPTMFLMTDAQIPDERFLVLINDLLSTGEIPDLFTDDEYESAVSGVRNECKSLGLMDTRENCWNFFIEKVRRLLKVILCFSPVGNKLRIRARKFPGVVNCTSINWFHEWPEEALISVSYRFLSEDELLNSELAENVSRFMAFVHKSVNEMSQKYYSKERRYNYTTPKSFLEQIKLYQALLKDRHSDLQAKMQRLENGLEKLKSTSQQVDDLKAKLKAQEVELAIKNEDANKLIQVVGSESEKVSKEKAMAAVEEEKVSKIAIDVSKKQQDCERDLAKAEPALLAAKEALNTLNKNNLTELKSFGSPPTAVINVLAAVMCLMAPDGKIPKDRSWKAAKVWPMGKVDQFLDQLVNFDKEHIHENCLKAVNPYIVNPEFNPEFIKSKSLAAAGLCAWVTNILKFYEVFCEVEPKRIALNQANLELSNATSKLATIQSKIASLEAALAKLTAQFEEATAAKIKCQNEADMTYKTIELANRLVGGLASENIRWAQAVENFELQKKTLPGDILLVTAFISYLGSFSKKYRNGLLYDQWSRYLKEQGSIPFNESLDPIQMLTDGSIIAKWNNEGLPSDKFSVENATILTNCERWPLMIDPQLQGIKWIKNKYPNLRSVCIGDKGYLDTIERAITAGDTVLIENMGEYIDPVLDPVIGRNTIKKGKAIKIGDKEVEYSRHFRLILHTKLGNPHYPPEIQAQTTLINFTVTPDGLEDQLLAGVVSKERPDLERLKSDLTRQQNEFKITLKELEDSLLARLSSAEGNFLGDYALVENLETTKRTAIEIEEKVAQAKITEVEINEARELYRPAASRASVLYFIMNDLNRIHPMYQFSLKAFSIVFELAIDRAETSEDVKQRIQHLLETITFSIFVYTTRSLFESDKMIFTAQMTFQIMLMNNSINVQELDFLLRFPVDLSQDSPVDFLSNHSWGGIKVLSQIEEMKNLDKDIEGSAKRWKKFIEGEAPENDKLPQEWKNKTPLQKLCIMRALRPDRMIYALTNYINQNMGEKYAYPRPVPFTKSYEETSSETPVFFILSPGVDPLKDVEAMGKKLGYSTNDNNFHNVSLGQGQEVVAENAIELSAREGHWVVLQNVHLVAKWLPTLEKILESIALDSHKDFRLYISAEPAGTPDMHVIPQGILEFSIKITNEPPTGMHANLHKALNNFSQDTLEMCAKENEFKTILFALCYFHAVVSERRKFGPQGWNRSYPFNVGDLTISVNVLYNYLESNPKVPWVDLRYLFGEIMYGGHITDDWDRKLCRTYLEEYLKPEMLDGELLFAPGFAVPTNTDFVGYHNYIDEHLPTESPYLYGLHPNAEIDFLTTRSEKVFRTIFELQPQNTDSGGEGTTTKEEKIKNVLDEILEKLPEEFPISEIMGKVPPEERTPYVVVAFQECERMNYLTNEIRRSLKTLDLGLKGELTITSEMEELGNNLFFDSVPDIWSSKAYPSLYSLALWYADLLQRIKQLEMWIGDFQLPAAVWLGGFFNPQSFLTAIMQQMARKNEWPLDRMVLQCDVTKKSKEDMAGPPREGAYVCGLFMEGARWDVQSGMITESRLKELHPAMPVIYIRAIPVERQDLRMMYACPVYKTKQRGPTFVWTFNLKSKIKPSTWVLGGVALLLQI